jgi:hypothetical protein
MRMVMIELIVKAGHYQFHHGEEEGEKMTRGKKKKKKRRRKRERIEWKDEKKDLLNVRK